MQESPTLTYLVLATLFTFGTSVIAWLVKRNASLEQRIEDTNRETIDALKSAAKLGEKVPDMTEQLQQSSDENRLLRARIGELEKRS